MLEAHTYGDSKAAEVLADMLSQDSYFTRKVGRYWGDYTYTLDQLRQHTGIDNRVRKHLGSLFHDDMMKKLDESNLPEKIRTYLKNIMVKRWRQIKEEV